MIDFQNIRYTTAGLECYYLGQRRSGDGNVHRFAVVNPAGEKFAYYNDQGQRIEFDDRTGKWVATPTGHQIIAPPKIVEVTRWVALYKETVDSHGSPNGDGFYVCPHQDEPKNLPNMLAKQKHTFRFEVPNE